MARRVVALAFALVVAVTPVANGICGVFCAEQHSAGADSPHHHHSSDVATEASHHYHHHHATAEAPASMAMLLAVAHPCIELGSFVLESRDSLRPAAAGTALIIPRLVAERSSTSVVNSQHGPPGPARSVAPLRI